jgi:hypothetical protein
MTSLQVQLIDVNRELVHVDPVNHALLVTHADGPGGAGGSWAISQGQSFTISNTEESLPNTNIDFVLTVTNTTHVTLEFASEGTTTCWFYDAPTHSDNGGASTFANRNRNSALANTTTAQKNPTVSSVGTQLWSGLAMIGDHRQMQHFILDAGDYLIRMTEANGIRTWQSVTIDIWEPDLA